MNQDVSIPAKMPALVRNGAGFDQLRVCRVPIPHPGPDRMLARVRSWTAHDEHSYLASDED